jgi:hypothetical protein
MRANRANLNAKLPGLSFEESVTFPVDHQEVLR